MSPANGYDPTTQPRVDDDLCHEWVAFQVTLKALSPQGCNVSQATLVERIQIGEDVIGELDDVIILTSGNTGPSPTANSDFRRPNCSWASVLAEACETGGVAKVGSTVTSVDASLRVDGLSPDTPRGRYLTASFGGRAPPPS